MMRKNLSPNIIHGYHGNPSKHLLVIRDEDIMEQSTKSQSSQIIQEFNDDEPTETVTETMTETMTERKE